MLSVIENVITADEAERILAQLADADWQDGRASAGGIAASVKVSEQLTDSSAIARDISAQLLPRLTRHPEFVSAALPHRFFPLRFGRYHAGGGYGTHVDGSIMSLPGSPDVVRSDLSATLFLSSPGDYEGGELVIESDFGATEVKLDAGDLVIYPSSSLHRVQEVSAGSRTVVLVWLQSMVRDAGQRSLLYDLDQSVQALTRAGVDHDELMRLTGVYHNLLRRWAEV